MALQRISSMFRAFSGPTRLRILRLLQAGECCVGDLVSILELPQPSVSRHLADLREAGLVTDRKQGLWVYYSLTAPEGAFHQSLLCCLECCFREAPELQADARRAARLKEAGGCCPEEKK